MFAPLGLDFVVKQPLISTRHIYFDSTTASFSLWIHPVLQDPGAKRVLDRFATLLSKSFDDRVTIERVPSSTTVPIGGLDAQTAIIVTSCVGDRPNALKLLDRLFKRVAAGGGKFGVPPTHIIVLSSLGTERVDKFPYNTQNMLGGKLSKRRDVEEAVIGTVQGRMPDVQVALDYTIFKIGDVVDDIKSKGPLSLMPGDVLDGSVGVDFAANVLLQAVAFQPAARNATLSAAGAVAPGTEITDAAWDDMFLRLDGPELLRVDGLAEAVSVEKNDVKELASKYDSLAEFIGEWSQMYEGGAKGTGLTTPLLVGPSSRKPSETENAVRRSGVRMLFKQTNTGRAYKSKDEEKEMEGDGPPAKSDGDAPAPPPKRKAKKEGGIEVLAEQTSSGDLRVRARRCNMDINTVVKEISEETILKGLERGVKAWVKELNELNE